jgi:hypothetical protein
MFRSLKDLFSHHTSPYHSLPNLPLLSQWIMMIITQARISIGTTTIIKMMSIRKIMMTMTALKKRTTMIPNRNIMTSLDGVLPKLAVSVSMAPWDPPDLIPEPPPAPVFIRVYNGK